MGCLPLDFANGLDALRCMATAAMQAKDARHRVICQNHEFRFPRVLDHKYCIQNGFGHGCIHMVSRRLPRRRDRLIGNGLACGRRYKGYTDKRHGCDSDSNAGAVVGDGAKVAETTIARRLG